MSASAVSSPAARYQPTSPHPRKLTRPWPTLWAAMSASAPPRRMRRSQSRDSRSLITSPRPAPPPPPLPAPPLPAPPPPHPPPRAPRETRQILQLQASLPGAAPATLSAPPPPPLSLLPLAPRRHSLVQTSP